MKEGSSSSPVDPGADLILLGGVTWIGSHPARSESADCRQDAKPLRVDVVALDWKWPSSTPIRVSPRSTSSWCRSAPVQFRLPRDRHEPFFVPQLGSQIYEMAGMETASEPARRQTGRVSRISANYSGDGFADMRFTVNRRVAGDFDKWIATGTRRRIIARPGGTPRWRNQARPCHRPPLAGSRGTVRAASSMRRRRVPTMELLARLVPARHCRRKVDMLAG